MRDPHEILGVPPGAAPEAVHRAFRTAARRHHPDVNPGDPDAADRFRAVVAAYQILQRLRPAHSGARPAEPSTNVTCLVSGRDLYGTLLLDPDLLAGSPWVLVDLTALHECAACAGSGEERLAGAWGRIERWECETCHGASILRIHRRVRVRVPVPFEEGARIRLRSLGLDATGDAIVVLRTTVTRSAEGTTR